MARSKDKDLNPNELTDKERLFVSFYITHWNGAQAVLDAGYETKNRHTARTLASEILSKPHIRAEIEGVLSERRMSALEALDRMSELGRADITQISIPDDEGGISRFKLFDKLDDGTFVARSSAKQIKKVKLRRSTTTGKNGDTYDVTEQEIELHSAPDMWDKILKIHKVYEKGLETTKDIPNPLPFIPADLIAPDFINVYRDMRAKKHVEYLLKGGRGSTKSAYSSLGFIHTIINNPEIHGLVLRQTANTLRDSVFNQLLWAIDALGLTDLFKSTVSPLSITYLPTGQKIFFRGADDPTKIKSIKPKFGYIGILWFEELDQFHGPEAIRKIEQSAIRGGITAIIIKSFNPPRSAQNWVNKYCLVPKENQLQHSSTYLTVPVEWLGPTFFSEAEHLRLTNPLAYAHEYLGEVNGTGGQVFQNLQIRPITDSEISTFETVLHGGDWGWEEPYSYGKMHYDSDKRILYIFGEYRAQHKSNETTGREIQELGLYEPHETIIMDSSEPKSVKDYQAYGLNARGAEKGPDTRDYSYKWLQSLTAIVIDSARCPFHAVEFSECEYEQDKNGDFITSYPQKNDHAIDDTRYATNLIWRKRGK